jgi:formate dehydrogenase maturation protein FdhE
MTEKLTSDEYVAVSGCRCPACGNPDITGDAIEIDGNIAWQPVYCNNCEAEWNDVYTLAGYNDLKVKPKA